jgi:hypothetical protein
MDLRRSAILSLRQKGRISGERHYGLDAIPRPDDVQAIYDNIPIADKKLYWIEGTTRRWGG